MYVGVPDPAHHIHVVSVALKTSRRPPRSRLSISDVCEKLDLAFIPIVSTTSFQRILLLIVLGRSQATYEPQSPRYSALKLEGEIHVSASLNTFLP